MRISIKPLLILGSLILGCIGFFLPATIVQYRMMVDANQANTSTLQTISGEGLVSFYDEYGQGALPCAYGRMKPAPDALSIAFQVWQFIGKALSYVLIALGAIYTLHRAVRQRMHPVKFLVMTAILLGSPAAIFLTFRSPSLPPMCDFKDLYQMTAFAPYWPTALALIAGITLGVWGHFFVKDSSSQKVDSTTTGSNV